MFYLTLKCHGNGFETFLGVRPHTSPLSGWRKFVRRHVIEQQKWAQFVSETIVVKDGPNRKTIADPVRARTVIGTT